ncbi:MAG: ATP-binding protein [Gemmatimonadales bacterium]
MTAPVAPLRLYVRRRETADPERRVEISIRVPTDLDVVEEAVDLMARHCLACGFPPRAARFNLRVALCEALANAIIYGNALDPAKDVHVRADVARDRIALHVKDEGQGFDPTGVPDPTAPERLSLEDGRGLFLIRQLVDEVRFNDRGNSICMIMHRD